MILFLFIIISKFFFSSLCNSPQDTGCGIPTDEQGKLFKLFTQIKGDRPNKHLSTGLGLVLSRRLARVLNGDLFLVESSGEGSVFCLRMPYGLVKKNEEEEEGEGEGKGEEEKKDGEGEEERKGEGKEEGEEGKGKEGGKKKEGGGKKKEGGGKKKEEKGDKKGKKKKKKRTKGEGAGGNGEDCPPDPKLRNVSILVVDDNVVVRKVLLRVLRDCKVVWSGVNGEDALKVFESKGGVKGREIDLVIMDCLMPVMDGYAAAGVMRERGYCGPILALTGELFCFIFFFVLFVFFS